MRQALLFVLFVATVALSGCREKITIAEEDGGCSGVACGASCCHAPETCVAGACCQPNCDGRSCGSDGCGGSCGGCEQANFACNEQSGQCECSREDDRAFCAAQGKSCGTARGKDRCGRDAAVTCSFCGEHEVCDPQQERCRCVAETNAELCAAAGKTCGALEVTDRCGEARTLDCGGCDVGFVCDAGTSSCIACLPDDVATLCDSNQAACGAFAAVDNCGENRQVDCGGCAPGSKCEQVSNRCVPCVSESDAEHCARIATPALDCGTVTGVDNCNVQRTFSCGTCAAPRFCDSTLHCHDCIPESNAVFCGNLAKQCGPASGPDTCGANRSVGECGPCAVGERCDSGTCAVCVGETNAQLCALHFKNCGAPTVLDSCGLTRTPNCGSSTCSGALTCNDGVCSDGVHPTNDTCAHPQRLMFDASGVASATGELTGAVDDYSGSCGGSGNDLVYAFTLTQPLNVQVVVTATSTSMQPAAYLRDGCTNTEDLICGYAPNLGGNATLAAQALPAGTYHLIVDGYSGNGPFSLTVTTMTPPPAPANDSCAAPETLVFTSGVARVAGDTLSATNDYGDSCNSSALDGPDLVYKLTVTSPAAVVATVVRDAASTAFRPALELLSSCPGGGTAIACATETNGVSSVARPNLAPGDYFLVVDGTVHSYGQFTLEVKLLPPVTNDLCSGAAPIALLPVTGSTDLQGTVFGDTSIATDAAAGSCHPFNTGHDLVYSFEIPAATQYAVRIDLVPTSGSMLWPSLFVRTGCTAADAEKGCVAQSGPATAALNFARLGPGTYDVFVDGWSTSSNGPFDLTITASVPPPPPSNDACARPIVVALDPTTGSAQITGTTASAADDYVGGCAASSSAHTGPDLVYAVSMPAAGGLSARVTAAATSPDYKPVVYIQSVCGQNVTDQACGNYNANGFALATAGNLPAGAVYYIVVDGNSATSGDFTLDLVTFGALSNDDCATAKTMVFNSSGDFSDQGDLCSAGSDTTAVVGQTCALVSGYGKDVVYKLVTSQPQNLTVSYRSGQAWTSEVYIRTACGTSGTQLLCNEVSSGALNTLTAKNLPAGEYYVWLDNDFYGDCGVFTMTAHLSSPPAPPPNDLCTSPETVAIDAATGIGTISGTTDSAGDDLNGACGSSSGGDVVYSFILSAEKSVEITVTPQAGSDLEPIVYLRTDCAQATSELSCTRVGATATAAMLQFARLPPGTYYLVVDSLDLNATGPFDVAIATGAPGAPAANDVCISPTPLPPFDPTTLKTSISGDTLAGNNDETSGCATGAKLVDGPDLVYLFQLAADAKVTATVTRDASNATYKPAIAIRRGCALSQEVACSTDAQIGASGSTSVTAALTAGTWYVFVDGIDGSFGGFTLELSQQRGATVVAGDSCGNPLALTLTGTTATASGDLRQAGLTDDYAGASCASNYSSPDLVYALTLTSDSFVTVTMAAGATGGGYLDAGSYLRRTCDDASSELGCAATWADGTSVTYTTTRLAAGTYYLFADSYSSALTGTFDLTVTVDPATGPAPANDACGHPTPITFTGGAAQVTGDTSAAFDDYGGSGSCWAYSGALSGGDVTYSFTATAGATLTAVVTADPAATGYAPALYVRDSCASSSPSNQMACNTSTGSPAGLIVPNLAAGTYYLVVDGQERSGGAFTLDLFLQSTPMDNSSCASAQPLVFTTSSSGASVAQAIGDTGLGSSTSQGITQASQYCFSAGNELYYSFTTTDLKNLTIDLTSLDPNFEPAVYVRSSCSDPQTQVVCKFSANATMQVQKLRLPAGAYTIVTDAEDSSHNGPFTMKVMLADPPPPPAWDTCRSAQPLTLPASGSPALAVSDSTLPANDDYSGGCANGSNPMNGGDLVYTFTVSANALVTARVTPHANSPSYKAAVYIRSSCAAVSDDVCAFPQWGSGPSSPAIARASLPVGTYFLLVDGINGTAGDFDLELSQDQTLYVAGDHCINATSLDSAFISGSLPGERIATFTGTTVGASNDGDGACQTYSGADVVYRFSVARNSVVAANLAPSTGSSFSGYLYLRTSCTDSSTQVYCKTPGSGTSVSGTIFNVDPGTYFLFVDSLNSWSGLGAFDGSVSVRDTPVAPANDFCRGATELNFVGGTGTAQTVTLAGEDSTLATHDSSGNCSWAGGNDLVYTFTTSAAYKFQATATPDAASGWLRPSMYLRSACGSSAPTAEAACGAATGAGQAVTIRTNSLPAGTWFLFVDSAPMPGDSAGGRFSLTATLDPVVGTVPANDACSGAQPITLSGPAPSVTTLSAQTTAGAADDTTLSCGQAGPDVVYYFDLSAAAQVKAKVTAGTGYNPAVALRSTCATAQIICAATASGSIAEATAPYLPAGRYFVWVDAGNAGSSGTFDLELTLATPVVAAPPNNDLCTAAVPTLTQHVGAVGTTVGALNNFFNLSAACASASAPGADVVYAYTPAADGAFTVLLIADSADLAV